MKGHGVFCALSSNLNILRNADEIFRANPDEFRISLSGFTQPVYEQTHAKGNIERVKENMRLLQEARRRTGNLHTKIVVYYHKYRHNLHEAELMQAYATSLGFRWMENFAFYMPLEKALAAAEGRLEREERAFVETMYALPVVPAIEAAREYAHEPCRLWSEQIVLDLQGNAILCCALYDFAGNTLGSFLDMTPEQLMQAKHNHPTCDRCTRNGLHRYYEYFASPPLRSRYEALIAENLQRPACCLREEAQSHRHRWPALTIRPSLCGFGPSLCGTARPHGPASTSHAICQRPNQDGSSFNAIPHATLPYWHRACFYGPAPQGGASDLPGPRE